MKQLLAALVLGSSVVLGCGTPTREEAPSLESTGQVEREIIGGVESFANDVPWQVRITLNGSPHCGGSLIHRKWVLTAAHCVNGFSTSSLRVIAGDHRISVTEATEQVRTVTRSIVHPSYRSISGAPVDDVALIELSSPVSINKGAQIIPLNTPSPDYGQPTDSPFPDNIVSGWGWTSAYGSASDVLRQTNLKIYPTSTCNAAPLVRDLSAAQEICAGWGTSGGCHGDSGGPLYREYPELRLIGIVSWGQGGTCNSYTVFTRVSQYVSWITGYTGSLAPRQVRMNWTGAGAEGTIQLTCASTGETVSGSTTADGIVISLDCPNSTVTASCNITPSHYRVIDGFDRTLNGVTTYLPYTSTSASNSVYVSAGDTVSYHCVATD
ncbi:serine protease [Stigmatella sp. ncwal1]|uniref:Serine protease n=1 Tax=Stigmatella ashevillensis TaxID=2995309 RepID=A0ABT5DBJ8_9BACT|nr:serine protease [Stigmatella ashevillena]MDC0711044.1 serine protease [Stigmatella ashevillena]